MALLLTATPAHQQGESVMATHGRQSRSIDYEFLILGPILALLLYINIRLLTQQWSLGEASAMDLLRMTLTTVFYALLVILLFVRRPAKNTTNSWTATLAAYVGTFLPFSLILNTGPTRTGPTLGVVSIALMLVGLAGSIYAVAWLGRSFGAVPAARRLVRSGPYGLVRHPLYVAEMIGFVGVVLGQLTVFSLIVLFAAEAVQVFRALQEEKVLVQAFPEYESYSRETRRFIPGVI